ncbi:glycosyltransferase [Streptomyces sp. NPDC004324]
MGVVIPAHNEERHLGACLRSVQASTALAAPIPVVIVVTADACTDATAAVALRAGAHVLSTHCHNVGAARAVGVERALELLDRAGPDVWLAMTDADTLVPTGWLAHQVQWARRGYDAVLGTIRLAPSTTALLLEGRHNAQYFHTRRVSETQQAWEHPHVHGANLGVSASAYLRVGGFAALPTGEDRDLAARLSEAGRRIARTDQYPVLTAGRLRGRAPCGLSDVLASLHAALTNPVD